MCEGRLGCLGRVPILERIFDEEKKREKEEGERRE